MSLQVHINYDSPVEIDDVIRLPLPPLLTYADYGNVAITQVIVDDPDGTLDPPRPLSNFRMSETTCTPTRIFKGWIGERDIARGDGDRSSLRTGVARQWTVQVMDINNILHRHVLRGSGANRPAETDIERVNWLLDEVGSVNIADYGLIATTGGVDMDAADYRG
ncbi:MAG TPA: hypothetical protein VFS32_15060, partial [Candidatus Limnocylindrales bacterium]|nr:hypothetical protein [Candidatus Limnocylindrales bacterium]